MEKAINLNELEYYIDQLDDEYDDEDIKTLIPVDLVFDDKEDDE